MLKQEYGVLETKCKAKDLSALMPLWFLANKRFFTSLLSWVMTFVSPWLRHNRGSNWSQQPGTPGFRCGPNTEFYFVQETVSPDYFPPCYSWKSSYWFSRLDQLVGAEPIKCLQIYSPSLWWLRVSLSLIFHLLRQIFHFLKGKWATAWTN